MEDPKHPIVLKILSGGQTPHGAVVGNLAGAIVGRMSSGNEGHGIVASLNPVIFPGMIAGNGHLSSCTPRSLDAHSTNG
jgi:hypothetical protein